MSASVELRAVIDQCVRDIKQQMERRCYRAANELRNASLVVLAGNRGGRRYRVPGTEQYYTASSPGEPPAARTGTFMKSWQPTTQISGNSFISRIESNVNVNGHNLGAILEYGTCKMAPRPHHEKIQQMALPKIRAIYEEPYF